MAAENTDAAFSICPKNWKLPTFGYVSNEGWKRGSFYALASSYGSNLEASSSDSSSDTGASFYTNAGPNTVPNFLVAGAYYGSTFYLGGQYGLYWSSTLTSSTLYSKMLSFTPTKVNVGDSNSRRYGYAVRCLAK